MGTKTVKLNDASTDDLAKYAREVMGLTIHSATGRDKLIAKMREVEPSLTSIALPDEAPRMAAAPAEAAGPVRYKTSQTGSFKGELIHRINIAADEKDPHPVKAAVNGVAMLLPRGKDIEVPAPFVRVLKAAVRTNYHQTEDGELIPSEQQAYPFQDYGPVPLTGAVAA